jgi:hypothetical protein
MQTYKYVKKWGTLVPGDIRQLNARVANALLDAKIIEPYDENEELELPEEEDIKYEGMDEEELAYRFTGKERGESFTPEQWEEHKKEEAKKKEAESVKDVDAAEAEAASVEDDGEKADVTPRPRRKKRVTKRRKKVTPKPEVETDETEKDD